MFHFARLLMTVLRLAAATTLGAAVVIVWCRVLCATGPEVTAASSDSEPQRERRSCRCKADARNLVVCIDGTSNQFSKKNTNVVELYSRLVKDPETQITFYNSGIGTYATPSWKSWSYYEQVVGHKIDLAIAWRFERILLSAYLWLSENYKKGDRIFLFGFSRGAYQVRALSAMIEAVGLLHKGNQDQIAFAYQLYAETKPVDKDMKKRFKATFSLEDVCVHFVGAWDTVSSVGLIRDKNLPGTADGMLHVCYFRHALALHERRVKFLPEYVYGGNGPEIEPTDEPAVRQTKEVWFAGSHSDIGGGARENDELNQFGPSLRWMSFEATQLGLQLKKAPFRWKESVISDSLTTPWKLLEHLPIARLSYTGRETTTCRPHRAEPRSIHKSQMVHDSVPESDRPHGKPVEPDPYAAVRRIFDAMTTEEPKPLANEDLSALSFLTETDFGRQSLRDIATELTVPIATRLLASLSAQWTRGGTPASASSASHAARTVITAIETLEQRLPPQSLRVVARALGRHDKILSGHLMEKLSNPALPSPFQGHKIAATCIAFLPNSRQLVYASRDMTLSICDVTTDGTVIGPLEGHSAIVRSIAVHRSRIASCSVDGTFRVWDHSGKLVLGPVRAHGGSDTISNVPSNEGTSVGSGGDGIAFSRDGTCIATAGQSNRVALWDANTAVMLGEMVGHAAPVMCVAFSDDGTRLVSGSQDTTIRIWDVDSRSCIGEPLTGHTNSVIAVQFRGDYRRVYSASEDGTVRVWDAIAGQLVCEPLRADDRISAMVLSPDRKRLVSGSHSGKIAVWDAQTGAVIPTAFTDHRRTVVSVAFSLDGRKIATASDNDTIALWDATGDWKRDDVDDAMVGL